MTDKVRIIPNDEIPIPQLMQVVKAGGKFALSALGVIAERARQDMADMPRLSDWDLSCDSSVAELLVGLRKPSNRQAKRWHGAASLLRFCLLAANQVERGGSVHPQTMMNIQYWQLAVAAERGERIRNAAKEGHEAVHGTDDEREDKYRRWQEMVNDSFSRNPSLSFRAIAQIVGNRVGVSERTIRKHTKNPSAKK